MIITVWLNFCVCQGICWMDMTYKCTGCTTPGKKEKTKTKNEWTTLKKIRNNNIGETAGLTIKGKCLIDVKNFYFYFG